MTAEIVRDPDLEWLDHAKPTGLVLSPAVIKERTLVSERQTQAHTAQIAALLGTDDGPALPDPWAFAEGVLGWDARYVAGAPGGPPLPEDLAVAVPEHETTLVPDWAVRGFDGDARWQLLARLEPAGTDPDRRGAAEGWEATPQQRFERLLRETGVLAGVMLAGQVLSASAYLGSSASGNMRIGLYADNAGEPGALIATTEAKAFTATSSGHWQEFAFTSPPTTAWGVKYWLACHTDASVNSRGSDSTNQNDARRLIAQSYAGGLPDPFGAGSSYSNTRGMKMLVWTNP